MFKFFIVVIVGIFLIISLPPKIKKSFPDSGVRDNIVETLKEIK